MPDHTAVHPVWPMNIGSLVPKTVTVTTYSTTQYVGLTPRPPSIHRYKHNTEQDHYRAMEGGRVASLQRRTGGGTVHGTINSYSTVNKHSS